MKLFGIIYFLLASITAVALTACGANNSGEKNSMDSSEATTAKATAVYPQQIICTLAYRPNSGSRITEEHSLSIENQNTNLRQPMGEFDFHVIYLDGSMGGERSLRLTVTPINATTELTAQLYQLPLNSGPSNQFSGGHGFTGLTYVTHPTSGAELQFWCTAE